MKQSRLFCLAVVSITLFGCNGNNTSVSSTASLSYELTDDMIAELAEGYQVLGIYRATIANVPSVSHYYKYNCNDTVYEYTSYQEAKENPTMDEVASSYRYEAFTTGEYSILTQANLNLNNEVTNYMVTDGYGNYLLWEETGFANAFRHLSSSDFLKTENDFEFKLDMTKTGFSSVYHALTAQFSSYMGLSMEYLTITTDGYKLKTYKMGFAQLQTLQGKMDIVVEGKFTAMGADVVKPLVPVEGTSDNDFERMFKTLQNQNYRLDVNLGVKSYKMSLENGKTLLWDEFDKNGKKSGSYGYYQTTSKLQGVTRINDQIYRDGNPISGDLVNIYPTLKISSMLFELDEEQSVNGKKVFNYRKDVPQDIAMYYDYGMMAGSIVGELSIIIETNKVTIINKLNLSTEEFVYYDIGNVKNSLNGINNTCDDLKWSELLSNQEENLETLYNKVPQEALDMIPTIGGIYSLVQLDVKTKPSEPVILLPSSSIGINLYNSYIEKLEQAGFSLDEILSETDKLAYTKDYINGQKVCVKVYYGSAIFSSAQMLIYPSIIS